MGCCEETLSGSGLRRCHLSRRERHVRSNMSKWECPNARLRRARGDIQRVRPVREAHAAFAAEVAA